MSKIKIILVDDHALFREGLKSILIAEEAFEVIESIDDGHELFKHLQNSNLPDVVLLDLTMPKMNGFDVLKKMKKEYPSIRVIVLSMHDDGNYVAKCVRLGAYGYLIKNSDSEELIHAIHQVDKGIKYFNQEISAKMISIMSLEGEDTKGLSNKEKEVLNMLTEGMTTKEIAVKLFISTRTVETHRSNMLKKLDVKNTAELISKSRTLGII